MTNSPTISIFIDPARRALADASLDESCVTLLQRCEDALRDAGAKHVVRSDEITSSPFFPFVDPTLLRELVSNWDAQPICVVEARPHAIGSFAPKRGFQDFSHTLDSGRWRDLEDMKVLHPLTRVTGSSLLERRDDQPIYLLDPLSAFEVRSEADLELALRIEASGIARDGVERGRSKWRKL